MKYNPSYGDKQRDAQKKKKEEQVQGENMPASAEKEEPTRQLKEDKNPILEKNKRAS